MRSIACRAKYSSSFSLGFPMDPLAILFPPAMMSGDALSPACSDHEVNRAASLHGDVDEQADEDDIPAHRLPPFGRRVVQHQAEGNVAAEPEAQGKDDPFPGDGCFTRRCHGFPLQELVSFVKKGRSVLEWCGEHSLFGKAITCVAATTLLEQGRKIKELGQRTDLAINVLVWHPVCFCTLLKK